MSHMQTPTFAASGHEANDTWLYAALCAGNEIVEVEVHKREKGFRHLSLDLPSGADRGKLVIFTVRDGRVFAYNIEVVRLKFLSLQHYRTTRRGPP